MEGGEEASASGAEHGADVTHELLREAAAGQFLTTTHDGKQYYIDVHIAYRRACLNAIEYLKKFGYTGEQAYLLLSCAPVEGRISGIVDIPNACCTLAIPTSIFDKDILPC